MSSFYRRLFPPSFFLWFPLIPPPSLSFSFDLSLVRKDPDTCFHSKHSEEASPCNNVTLNTKGTRPISSFDSYGVSLCHILPSLKASSPLKRNVLKKIVFAPLLTYGLMNTDVKSSAADSF